MLAAVVDDEGGFVATGVPHGPMSVRLFLSDAAQRVHTDWVAIWARPYLIQGRPLCSYLWESCCQPRAPWW